MCVQFLSERRWSNGFICSRCGHGKAYVQAAGDLLAHGSPNVAQVASRHGAS
ncbi:hypothetical protein E3U44_16405 [Nitrosococcus wardiae]|uniref:Transposase zinc-ribbon domain-containing protein n=1 Tax=Nitrosococcus wardiae TaxID=1814290 RepID=A0A4P7C2G4_9GAMM|nr:hypothetical protein E3U44_16405 [Nitrosococcus wardiae]